MDPTDRRTFLKAAGATLAASALHPHDDGQAKPTPEGSKAWKKAFMLGGV